MGGKTPGGVPPPPPPPPPQLFAGTLKEGFVDFSAPPEVRVMVADALWELHFFLMDTVMSRLADDPKKLCKHPAEKVEQ